MNTRPTTDKVKEAIFSMIGPYFDGGMVLDLFAGTGGLGIEALSRGMDKGIFVDREKSSVDIVKHNLQAAGFTDQAELYRNDAIRSIKALAKRSLAFRLVFLDPPYRMKEMDELMEEMAGCGMLEAGAVIVVEHDAAHHYPEQLQGLAQRKVARYGDTAVSIYDYIGTAAEQNGHGGQNDDK